MSTIESNLTEIRTKIRTQTHADESEIVGRLLAESSLNSAQRRQIVELGRNLVKGCRRDSDKAGTLDVFMQEFSLSSKEGVALMCLAESLLRVPDSETADDLIAEKVLSGDWAGHLGQSDSLFVNASTWGLMLTGRVVRLDPPITRDTDGWLQRLVDRMGEPVVRTAVRQAMKIMGRQYVLGRDISEAMERGSRANKRVDALIGDPASERFSFDMLGEGARTSEDARRYYDAYLAAIRDIGSVEAASNPIQANGISVKLSALHPRYEYRQRQRVLDEMLPRLIDLAAEAKKFGLGFSIDAEEADRLDLSLDIFEALARAPSLRDWQGLGFVLQAYSKRAPWVADWLIALARDCKRQFMVRLVKGAYWDSEIKHAQEQGFSDYPVYTRKANTDLSYQICAERLLQAQDCIYPQFATHNAHTAALILELGRGQNYEFQRLHGMGDLLHRQLQKLYAVDDYPAVPVRVYAPVGAHKDLLPYLVRRLLENGANSSFVNRFMDRKVDIAEVITDVQQQVETAEATGFRHSSIPVPLDIFRQLQESRDHKNCSQSQNRSQARGLDLANADAVADLLAVVHADEHRTWRIGPIVGGKMIVDGGEPIHCPVDSAWKLGTCRPASVMEIERAMELAAGAQPHWNRVSAEARAGILRRAADAMEAQMMDLVGLICREAGRTLDDGIAEVREAVDFLRYYGLQAESMFKAELRGRGVFLCISPWNFPLALFVGQVAAALAAGNSVIAKPADSTPIVASEAVRLLHESGVPGEVLNFLPGSGSQIGALLLGDPRLSGVAFTGSTGVAMKIHHDLVHKGVEPRPLIAETGGQNVMLVDSSALLEQVVDDCIRSAFLSAGQRCSALRVLYVQEDIADALIKMLIGAMRELSIGQPWHPHTDVGPVISAQAQSSLQAHIAGMTAEADLLCACPLPELTERGTFVAPQLFELRDINQLEGEVFGPILHLIRFKRSEVDRVLQDINNTGFGLTLGVHSRIQEFADYVIRQTRVGNNYVNRDIVGAVVGVNPFGGQGLSGTGPKAGGPHYLSRFVRPSEIEPEPELKVQQQSELAINSAESHAQPFDPDVALKNIVGHQRRWDLLGAEARAQIFDQAAGIITELDLAKPDTQTSASVVALGSSPQNSVPQAPRETKAAWGLAHCLRSHTDEARDVLVKPLVLPGPTGETNLS